MYSCAARVPRDPSRVQLARGLQLRHAEVLRTRGWFDLGEFAFCASSEHSIISRPLHERLHEIHESTIGPKRSTTELYHYPAHKPLAVGRRARSQDILRRSSSTIAMHDVSHYCSLDRSEIGMLNMPHRCTRRGVDRHLLLFIRPPTRLGRLCAPTRRESTAEDSNAAGELKVLNLRSPIAGTDHGCPRMPIEAVKSVAWTSRMDQELEQCPERRAACRMNE